MAGIDPNDEWLGHVQPVGLVVAPIVLARYGLTPEIQTRADTEAMRDVRFAEAGRRRRKAGDPRALKDPWGFLSRRARLAGGPGRRRSRRTRFAG